MIAAAFLVPAVLSAVAVRAHGVIEAISWAIACAAVQFALVVGVGFAVLGYGRCWERFGCWECDRGREGKTGRVGGGVSW